MEMLVKHVDEVSGEDIRDGVKLKWVISNCDGAENFYMRLIECEATAEIRPMHYHEYEHEIFIVEGEGYVIGERERKRVRSGDAVLIMPNEKHSIEAIGRLRFLCFIPRKAIGLPVRE
jgi:quercetin dioxygenase-like cupin family protein